MRLNSCIRYGNNQRINTIKTNGNLFFRKDFETYRALTLLDQRIHNNGILLSELGVSKTAMVGDLTYAVMDGLYPRSFLTKGFVEMDVCRLPSRVILSAGERY